MKNAAIALVMALLVIAMPVAAAEEASEELDVGAGFTPDSPVYGLDRAVENVQLLLAFDSLQKAKLHYQLAKERLAEARELAKQGKSQYVAKLQEEYENELGSADSDEEKAVASGQNVTDFAETVTDETHKHVLVLQRVLESAPDQAKPALEAAIKRSLERQTKIAERIEEHRELVNMTIAVGNKTITVEVPAKVATKFLEKAEKVVKDKEELREHVLEKVEEKIALAEKAIANVKEKAGTANATRVEKYLENAERHLAKAKEAFEAKKYGEAWGQATAALQIAKNGERFLGIEKKLEERKAEIKEKLDERKEALKERLEELKKKRSGETNKSSSGCVTVYQPVCGADGKTYGNSCEAEVAGVKIKHSGECGTKNTNTSNTGESNSSNQ
ncbi:MAG TPA: DUF5667 domain-containing protein [archaeon]|nr:DUF5667 domain-containing protein [archaeon]